MKTQKGYVNGKYVFLKKNLAKFLSSNEVKKNNYSIRLITYNIKANYHKNKLRRTLYKENNIYLKYFKNTFSVYLVNFINKDDALEKQRELFDIFPNSVIYSKISIKNNDITNTFIKKNAKKTKMRKVNNISSK